MVTSSKFSRFTETHSTVLEAAGSELASGPANPRILVTTRTLQLARSNRFESIEEKAKESKIHEREERVCFDFEERERERERREMKRRRSRSRIGSSRWILEQIFQIFSLTISNAPNIRTL